MAIQLNNTDATRRRIERRASVHRMPKWYPHSAVWRVYTDPSGGGDFNTYYGNIRSDFNLVSYWVFFSMGSAGGNDYAIGADGSDAESGVTRITGRWQRMACRIPGLGLDIQFWWDLPDTAAVISKNLTNPFTTHSTHRLAFGAPAHTDNEGIAGRIAWIKIWEYALPQAALIRESESPWPVLKEYEPYLYAVVPCTGPDVDGAADMPVYLDYSGRGNHFYPFDGDTTHDRAVDPGPSFPPRLWRDRDLDLDADAIAAAGAVVQHVLAMRVPRVA